MATIINNPGDGGDRGPGAGLVIGIVVAVILVVLAFVYLIPAIRGSGGNGGTPQVNVPSKVDINVNKGGGQ